MLSPLSYMTEGANAARPAPERSPRCGNGLHHLLLLILLVLQLQQEQLDAFCPVVQTSNQIVGYSIAAVSDRSHLATSSCATAASSLPHAQLQPALLVA